MRIINNLIGVVLVTLLITSCQRENNFVDPAVLPGGGTGGKITIRVTPQHHENNLGNFPSDTTLIYIKYGSETMPVGLSSFDQFDTAKFDASVNRSVVTFNNLTYGKYFIYAEGKDPSLAPKNTNVIGGSSFIVVDSNEKVYDVFLHLNKIED